MANIHQVPLVVYIRGKRIECGAATVKENGEIYAQVKKDMVEFVKTQFLAKPMEVSLTPKDKPPFIKNTPVDVVTTTEVIVKES